MSRESPSSTGIESTRAFAENEDASENGSGVVRAVNVGEVVRGSGSSGCGDGSSPNSSSAGQRRPPKQQKSKKKTMKRTNDTKSRNHNWRHRLNACRSPSTESIADLPEHLPLSQRRGSADLPSNTSFPRSSSVGNGLTSGVGETSTFPVSDWPTDDGEDTVVIHVPRADGPPRPLRAQFPRPAAANSERPGSTNRSSDFQNVSALAPYGPAGNNRGTNNWETICTRTGHNHHSRGESSNQTTLGNDEMQIRETGTRNSPFCPCLSPNDSDEEGGPREQGLPNATGQRRQLCARQIISLARDLRTRFVLAADATNQNGVIPSTATRTHTHNIGDGVMVAEPYPVHTAVEYTHYLVPDLVTITSAPYYWGVMDRFEAEKLLESKPEGTFLLRDSAQIEYLFSVSFRRYQRTLHARIEQLNHRFSFDSYDSGVFSAATVTELVDHYSDPARCMLFEPQLSKPLNRNFVFPLQHMCRAAVCATIDYSDIQSLPIPKKFKDYLREYHYRQPVRVRNLEGNN